MFKINTVPGQAAQEKGYARYPEDFPHLTHGADFAAWSSGDDWEIETILDGQALVDQWNSFCKCCENGIRVWEVKYQHQDGSVDFLWYGNLVDEAEAKRRNQATTTVFYAILTIKMGGAQWNTVKSRLSFVPQRQGLSVHDPSVPRQAGCGWDDAEYVAGGQVY